MRIWQGNPYYWEYNGKPLLLLGGSVEDNLFNDPRLMHSLETLQQCGGNYIRCTLSSRDEGNVWPYEKVGQLYDLNRFNPEYWTRLDRCLREAQRRDIIVQIEIWATFDFYRDNWLVNPFNPALNVNYTTETTRLETEWDDHPARKPQPFFHSPPALNDDRVLRTYQETFVRKVLDTSLRYPNVLHCLDNETSAPPEWAWYWAQFIHAEVRRRSASIQLTEMWDDHDLRGPQHRATYEHPEVFSFFEISQNNWQLGQVHYERIMWAGEAVVHQEGGIRPLSNVKVYGRLDHAPPSRDVNINRFWRNIFGGCASARFHRPFGGIGLDQAAQVMIKAARRFTEAFDLFHCEPRNDLLSEREPDEAYCLAIPGRVYALCFPRGGKVCLAIDNPDRALKLRWFDPWTAEFGESKPITADGSAILHSPDTGRIWLALIQASPT